VSSITLQSAPAGHDRVEHPHRQRSVDEELARQRGFTQAPPQHLGSSKDKVLVDVEGEIGRGSLKVNGASLEVA
jgi:hypothetical protein